MQKESQPSFEKGFSAIILVYNEEPILYDKMLEFKRHLDTLLEKYEIILSENGSTDRSPEICAELVKLHGCFRHISAARPSFGEAIRNGFRHVRFDKVLVFPVDLWGLDFIERAIPLLETHHVVYGSRFLEGATCRRPFVRTVSSRLNTWLAGLLLGGGFTDVNGIKMYRAGTGRKIMEQTSAAGPFIEVEIAAIIRNSLLRWKQIPIDQIEMATRHPAYIARAFAAGPWKLLLEYGRLRKLKVDV